MPRITAADALAWVADLARAPRPAGEAAEAVARASCASTLRERGFSTVEIPFSYSTLPGRWATSLTGFASIVALMLVGGEGYEGHATRALIILISSLAAIGWSAWWIGTAGILRLPWARATSVNLVATRGTPRLWLMAHLDSKSQPVPIGLRALGITVSLFVWLAAVVLVLLQVGTGHGAPGWLWIVVAGVAGGLPVMASLVGSASPGALDNASGVAAVLLVVGALAPAIPLGVVLTSAEELGLAGARAWSRSRTAATAINFDGLDDTGPLRFSWSGKRPGDLLDRLQRGAALARVPARVQRLPPGILTDGVALAGAGWSAVTLSKGGVRTLSRIHTRRDQATALSGEGVAQAAEVVVRLLEELER
ncbi:MAG: M28 family peptidase [Gemmatimonadaceae bacterium]